MEIFRRTVYGAYLQTCMLMRLPFQLVPSTTLNEKYSIQQTAVLGVNETPAMRYLAIGIGGHRSKKGADNIDLIETIQHETDDASCYRPLPFVLRPIDSDLTSTERDRYALRRIENHNGIDYAAYYLRRLDMTNVVPKMQQTETNGGVSNTTDFIPNSDQLNPVPPPIVTGGVSTVTGDFLSAVARLQVNFDRFDATEILNAAVVIYGSEDYAFISEMALCSGVDRSVTVTDPNGTSLTYNEVVAVQINTHISTMQPMKSQRDGFTATLDVGATEPLFNLMP